MRSAELPGSGAVVAGAAPPAAADALQTTVRWPHSVELAAVMAVALTLAVSLPLATTVFALILFGVLHNYFELRYVVGRFDGLMAGRLGEGLLVGLTAIALVRLLAPVPLARPIEILASYAMLAAVLALRLRSRSSLLLGSGVVLAAALGSSLTNPDVHFVVVTHLHNLLPLFFLWEWTASYRASNARTAFRLLHLGWATLVPALLLLGAFGAGATPDPTPASALLGDVEGFVRTLAPPGLDSVVGGRLLAVFAFLQLMHYYVWCRFFPSVGTAEAARTDGSLASLGLVHGRRLTGLVLGFAALTMLLFVTDFWLGRSIYGALAGYHAYLEYAILVLFVLASGRR